MLDFWGVDFMNEASTAPASNIYPAVHHSGRGRKLQTKEVSNEHQQPRCFQDIPSGKPT